MDNWIKYLECGARLAQIYYRNIALLSNDPLYDFDKISEGSDEFFELANALIIEVAPGYVLQYVPIYGFSDKTVEDSYNRYEKIKEEIYHKFSGLNAIRK